MTPDFSKYTDGLMPTIIQDASTKQVLMLGFMNAAALEKTRQEGKVTFYSRSKQRLWTKGETSANFLLVKEILVDCDADTLLIKADPQGPTCHTGTISCFGTANDVFSLQVLENIIRDRKNNPTEKSYTASLFAKGINKIAQKVGEEAVEIVIEAKDDNRELFLGEAADLMFHYLVLLQVKGYGLEDVLEVLEARHKK
ncbi:bifunctional phosphoribosyl-AMP cyclohydrolase/phosphoribosyl-ATP diphosphatase HisIE [Niabella beijingensis]|uniref:bifunctional phosphoribosyl-AMP cyclohydrolase/phosphoribosyl-ATP diphosphatase HisIE n=1 Tax=Niabella beijingensis TaxID=2872700 RepID=UPI001CBA78A2|nr:bifunctional phosphoribosyl-AMP cyclohydrolase/phosphoribosyl-ATP diphosphatase HisIE [Niabella beijingensis]MBZ4190958.1 bifunctional phosphoribosyl-AMP cyclohydrolase/phosphoribosyl-ATP diphosphatase HisIE [Niabella beijingensis]